MRSSGKNVANKKIKNKFFNIKKNKSLLKSISFKIHKYNDKNDSFPKLFFSCFCEFGCEGLLPTYLIPRINKNFQDHKKIVLGWQGREYFYKHLVDEFWEIDPKCMNLREKCKAFMHNSKELEALDGIGPVLARRIITYRDANGPFATLEALLEVSGIGPAKFAQFKEKIRL